MAAAPPSPPRNVARAGFGIPSLDERGGPVAVRVEELEASPFHVLLAFDCPHRAAAGTVVLIPPMSGVLPWIMREMIIGLLPRYRVLVPEWVDPRFVPRAAGSFGFSHNIAAVISALRMAGPGAGLIALCQSGGPSLAATAVMEESDDPATPALLILLGSPIDPAANPTSLSRHFATAPSFRLAFSISPVPFGYPGWGRPVYSADTQRSLLAAARLHHTLFPPWLGGNEHPDLAELERRLPFSDYSRVMMDVDARHFIENIDIVFRRRALPRGRLRYDGDPVDTAAIRRCALVTIEGTQDGIVGPGQTVAAHALCPDLPEDRRLAILIEGCDHLSLFRGKSFRNLVLPHLLAGLARWVD